MKFSECIKLGAGFYIGWEIAKTIDKVFDKKNQRIKSRSGCDFQIPEKRNFEERCNRKPYHLFSHGVRHKELRS